MLLVFFFYFRSLIFFTLLRLHWFDYTSIMSFLRASFPALLVCLVLLPQVHAFGAGSKRPYLYTLFE